MFKPVVVALRLGLLFETPKHARGILFEASVTAQRKSFAQFPESNAQTCPVQ
jgi:hypothetical protein